MTTIRQVKLWLDDPMVGCGTRTFLEVIVGDKFVHLLHISSLSHVKVPIRDYERAMRSPHAGDLPLRRGMIGEIRRKVAQHREYGYRIPGNFIKDAIEKLRDARRGDLEDEREAKAALEQDDLHDVGDGTVEATGIDENGIPRLRAPALLPGGEPVVNPRGEITWPLEAATVLTKTKKGKAVPVTLVGRTDARVVAKQSNAQQVPKAKMVKAVRSTADDDLAALTTDELAKRAKKMGYVEQPAPNGGVRKMRLLNFMRSHAKKGGK